MLSAIFLLLLGAVLLYAGGELLVDGSIRLARSFRLSNMVIGLTVVAFGTSCPELAATITAALQGSPDIAIGNAFGSNVANLGLILGLSALVVPFRDISGTFLKREVAFMIFTTVIVFPPMWWQSDLNRVEGLVLFVLLCAAVYWTIRQPAPADEHLPHETEVEKEPRSVWLSSLVVLAGVALLVGGAKALVDGAVTIATALGVSERVIGFTMVALGTSLPELAASIVATKRGEGDIVLGNLVGSNIFNLLCILGLTAIVVPIPVTAASLGLDYGVMLGISLLLFVLLATRRMLSRFEGAVLLVIYAGYSVYLYL